MQSVLYTHMAKICKNAVFISFKFILSQGRTLAGLILENFMQERKKAIWISVSNDLMKDAELDLQDVGLKDFKIEILGKVNCLYFKFF